MLPNSVMIGRLLVAAVLGGMVGFERERLLWAAGLRTHMLVCIGSCLIIIVSAYGFNDVLGEKNVVLDPSRIAAQVVSGVGFLGAGTILFRGEAVKGLTTAASLWAVAGIGLAAGSGLYVAATAGTIIILAVLAGIKPLEERYRRRLQTRNLALLATRGQFSIDILRDVAGPHAKRVQQFILRPSGTDDVDEVEIVFGRLLEPAFEEIIQKLKKLPGVTQVETPDLS
ncbi:MAG: MgtC/SapB family protein [Janthinobacterium lividum]